MKFNKSILAIMLLIPSCALGVFTKYTEYNKALENFRAMPQPQLLAGLYKLYLGLPPAYQQQAVRDLATYTGKKLADIEQSYKQSILPKTTVTLPPAPPAQKPLPVEQVKPTEVAQMPVVTEVEHVVAVAPVVPAVVIAPEETLTITPTEPVVPEIPVLTQPELPPAPSEQTITLEPALPPAPEAPVVVLHEQEAIVTEAEPIKIEGADQELVAAASMQQPEKVVELIKAGADVKAKDQHGWTALMYAANNGDKKSIEALITAGADVNAHDGKGMTALKLAKEVAESEEAAEMLAKAGAL